jgi:hypothetical protein
VKVTVKELKVPTNLVKGIDEAFAEGGPRKAIHVICSAIINDQPPHAEDSDDSCAACFAELVVGMLGYVLVKWDCN